MAKIYKFISDCISDVESNFVNEALSLLIIIYNTEKTVRDIWKSPKIKEFRII